MNQPDDKSIENVPGNPDLPDTAADEKTTLTARLVEVLDQYLADLNEGKKTSRTAILEQHPELASQLDACLAGIDFIQGTSDAADSHAAAPQLADFRILREVGRGGMGVVYEAEQISLDRRVALKVLRFGAVSEPAALERFRREAETVANLHHTNIVPIYSFGNEHGVNFYAMEFIEGKSLDSVLKESAAPLDCKTAAGWALQAAEALEHAHQRQVVHRDVKPSNLILDDEGRVWLTDFGLAKRLDDVTLSLTGALLGTPRYMSPEQAAASNRDIDHRSDIYSLGATLYELLTGQPAFTGQTHHEVIRRILEEEPVAPRMHRNQIPRDLETILLKCLSKSPEQRYQNAEDLAEDLRAFVHDRPISARRANLVELASRWFQRHRLSVLKTAGTVGGTAVVLTSMLFGWQAYQQARLASLSIRSEEPLIAEIDDSSGHTQTVTLPNQEPVDIAPGSVRLRLSAEGRLSHEYKLDASPGQDMKFQLPDDGSAASQALEVTGHQKLLAFSDGVDLILIDDEGVQRYDPVTPATIWSLNLAQPTQKILADCEGLDWTSHNGEPLIANELEVKSSNDSDRTGANNRFLDLNSDGEQDVVVAAPDGNCLIAISGKDGQALWVSQTSQSDSAGKPSSHRGPRDFTATFSISSSIGDIDRDGKEDLLVTRGELAATAASPSVDQRTNAARRWIDAISGATGETLWTRQLRPEWFGLAKQQSIPYAFQWFPSGAKNLVGSQTGGGRRRGGMRFRRITRHYQSHGLKAYAPDRPQRLSLASADAATGRPSEQAGDLFGLMAGTHLIAGNVNSGEVVIEMNTEVTPVQPVIWHELDGDGVDDAVLLERLNDDQIRCSAWSLTKREMLWEKTANARWSSFHAQPHLTPHWPLVVDLDDDDKAEIILPSDTSSPVSNYNARVPWGEIEVLRGSDGKRLWSQRILAMDQQIDQIAVGPDLNGDHVREIFTAALWGDRYDLYINAFSGADGDPLWWTRQDMPVEATASPEYFLGPLCWWHSGAGGWPLLAAQAHDDNSDGPAKFCLVSPASGQLVHSITGVTEVTPADADNDGVQDLFSFRNRFRTQAADASREMRVLAGQSARWRRLSGPRWSLGHDFDGDGVRDVLTQAGTSTHLAISGASGEKLWQTRRGSFHSTHFANPDHDRSGLDLSDRQLRDLDGDQIDDLLMWQRTGASAAYSKPIHAISGRTGAALWTADISVHVMAAAPLLDICDLDGDRQPEVVIIAAMDWDYGRRFSYGTNDQQLWLAVLEGASGRVIWKQPLTAAYGHSAASKLPYRFKELVLSTPYIDLDDDEVLDLVVPAETSGDEGLLEFRAYSGKTGSLLWTHALPSTTSDEPFRSVSHLTTADLDQDGRPELLASAMEETKSVSNRPATRHHHLYAISRDGQLRWQWKTETPDLLHRYRDQPLDRRGPIVAMGSDGEPMICLPFSSAKELVVLNRLGQPALRHAVESRSGERVWAVDGDGDGMDELVLAGEKGISAVRLGRSARALWQQAFDDFDFRRDPGIRPEVLGVTAANSQQAPTILVRSGPEHNSLLALDVMTGQPRWSCHGPAYRNRYGKIRVETIQPLNLSANLPPQIFFHSGHEAQCRQAILLNDHDSGVDTSKFRARLVTRPRVDDLRLARQLPWNRFAKEILGAVLSLWSWGLLYTVTLIVLPMTYVLYLWNCRRWGLRTLAMLPLIAALFLTGLMVDVPEPAVVSTIQKFILAIGFLPILLFVSVFAFLLAKQRWLQLGVWIGFAGIITLLLATLALWADSGSEPWLSGEHYAMTGWYLIFVMGAYLTGFAMVAALPTMVRSVTELVQPKATQISRQRA